MTRAALLPMGSDPFLNAYWLRHYAQVWADEVDELQVLMCGQDDPEIIAYIRRLVSRVPHAIMDYVPGWLVHGSAISQLVDQCKSTHIMLCEDDAFVRQKGAVDRQFRLIESGETDIVGSPRGSTNNEVANAALEKWGPCKAIETGDAGHALYPCFLFVSRANLLRIDGHYDSRNWTTGEMIKGLDYIVQENSSGDTFVSASYQLRGLGLHVRPEPQFRIEESKLGQWDNAPWFHVGSLSSGYGSHFLSRLPDSAYHAQVAAITLQNEPDWYKRCSFWRRAWAHWDGELPEIHDAYDHALTLFMNDIGMNAANKSSEDTLRRWDEGFQRLITWTE